MDAQKSAISIGKQEQGNQMAERQMAASLQQQEAMGDIETQRMNIDRQGTMLGMAQSEKAAASQAVSAADQKMWSGITGAAGALSSGLTGMSGAGMLGGGGGGATPTPLPTQGPQQLPVNTGGPDLTPRQYNP
jgi:hypothetical protein